MIRFRLINRFIGMNIWDSYIEISTPKPPTHIRKGTHACKHTKTHWPGHLGL